MIKGPSNKRSGKFITVITEVDNTDKVINGLRNNFNLNSFIIHSARGLTVINSKIIGKFLYVEKVIITILASNEVADSIFEFIYDSLEMLTKAGSFVYMGDVSNLTECELPQTENQLSQESQKSRH